ncbi:MAG: flagellar motor protein MotB, partial [Saprospiraceae bacterium]|nr:flagellar motor protein MotB [Saprospiraceae bacterium]
MSLILNVLVVVLVLGSLQSCVSKKKYDELLASKEATDAALAETQSQVKNLEETNAQLEQTMTEQK